LKIRGTGVGSAVGIATGVRSGVATTPGTLVSCDGAPGKIGTEGCVSGGGAGGGAGTCARATAATAANTSPIAMTGRAPRLDIKTILIAKKFSSRNPHPMMPRRLARAGYARHRNKARGYDPEGEGALQAWRVLGKSALCVLRIDVRDLRNPPACGFVFV
jgi:hypothetical protein